MKPVSKMNLKTDRRGERGAALITMLLVSVLLLSAGGGLIMSTMMSANNSIGSTAEMQAYYVAESGMQSALNVLRGNTRPLITTTDKINFRTAIIPDISNGPGHGGTLRLANWLPYNDPADPASLVPINLGTVTGGYRITVESADLNSHIVEFHTDGIITGSSAGTSYKRTFGTVGGNDEVTIRYNGQSATTLTPNPNVYPLTLNSNLGSFVIERPVTSTKNGVSIPKTNFQVVITQTLPWAATTILDGTFEGSVGTASSSVKATFEKATVKADGTTYTLNLASGTLILNLAYTTSPTSTAVPAKVTSPEPKRLLVKSYGFGPQGARKRLELMLSRAFLEIEAPATVTLRGADDCSSLSLDSGSSGAKYYSGKDHAGVESQRPAFAVSPCDEEETNAGIKKHDTVDDPEIGLLTDDETVTSRVKVPSFLKSADKARAYLNSLQTKAQAVGRYFKSGKTISDSINKPQFTFVDGDAVLTDGAGFLVVTGTLTMRGNANFRGMIMVLGDGVLIRNGGGNGDILGAITIASFKRTSGNFLKPTFETNGGGNSNVMYDSESLNSGIAAGTTVSGIREF
jgi:hypothetical protein